MKPVNPALNDAKLTSILQAERTAALGASLATSDLSEQRIKAYDYYIGDMSRYMPAPEGQSSAVSTDVQDVIEGLLPIILDAITSQDRIVEFQANSANDKAAAAQETDYVNYVFYQQNDGFLTLHNAVKDALLSKNCFVKWWMEPDEARTREKYEGLTQDAFAMLTADTDIDITDVETFQQPDPLTQQPATFYNVVTERTEKKLRPKIAAFPPEEFLVSKNARNVKDSPYLAHVQRKPQADVIARFPDKEEIIKTAPSVVGSLDNYEAYNRQTVMDSQDDLSVPDDANPAMREVEVTEHFIRLALEKDGIARRYQITTIGTAFKVLDIEEVTEWPIATGTPILMPHRFFGRAVADLATEIQEIKTSLWRSTLNNAYFANNGRMEVSETHASDNTIDDLLNNRVGGIVRTKMPGGLNQIETQPIGHWIAPIMEQVDSAAERRTGLSKNTTGLDIDSMNHARTGAVGRIMDAAEMRVKMMTRVLVETLIVDIFRGLHGMLQQYSEYSEVVELTGGWVEVDPREWVRRRHMKVNLPLGGVGRQQMVGFLNQVLNIQKEVIQTVQGGQANGPMVSLPNVYDTLDAMIKYAGLKSAGQFFSKPPPSDPNAPPPPNPAMVEAQAKAKAAQAQQQADAQLDQQEFQHEAQMKELDMQFRQRQADAEFAHKQELDRMKFEHDRQMAELNAGLKARIASEQARNKMQIDRQQAKLDRERGVGEV